MTLFVHAPNVHQGGGKVLLNALLSVIEQKDAMLVLDARMLFEQLGSALSFKSVRPTLLSRLLAEYWLWRNVKSTDHVVCFGNLPPLFPVRGKVSVFLQNRYLFGQRDFSEFSRGIKLRLLLERLWFKTCMRARFQVIVQSFSMKHELQTALGFESEVLPFTPELSRQKQANNKIAPVEFDFVYVSSAEPHKNHKNLIKAWQLLAEEGLFPSLALTVNTHALPGLMAQCEWMQNNLNIRNFSGFSHEEVLALYERSGALIFPSKLESFGLPLLEAFSAGLPILASELDWVRDLVEPVQTFDPNSPMSIARAVKRYLQVPSPAHPILNANEFLLALKGAI